MRAGKSKWVITRVPNRGISNVAEPGPQFQCVSRDKFLMGGTEEFFGQEAECFDVYPEWDILTTVYRPREIWKVLLKNGLLARTPETVAVPLTCSKDEFISLLAHALHMSPFLFSGRLSDCTTPSARCNFILTCLEYQLRVRGQAGEDFHVDVVSVFYECHKFGLFDSSTLRDCRVSTVNNSN